MTGEEALERVADTLERVADALDRFLTSPGPRAWSEGSGRCRACLHPADEHRHFTGSTACAHDGFFDGCGCSCPEYVA